MMEHDGARWLSLGWDATIAADAASASGLPGWLPRPLFWLAAAVAGIVLVIFGLLSLVVGQQLMRHLKGKDTGSQGLELTLPWFGLKLARSAALDEKRDQQIQELERGLELLEGRFNRLVAEIERRPIAAGGADEPHYT